MDTLRAFFHIGRLEWVTCQVPEIHSTEGGVKPSLVLGEFVDLRLPGDRIVIGVVILKMMLKL